MLEAPDRRAGKQQYADRELEAVLGASERTFSLRRILQPRILVWAAIAIAAVAAFYGLRPFGGGQATVSYVTEPVTSGSLTVIVTATGSAQPVNKVDVSSELSGTVRKVHVDYNTPVKAGQVLAELDTDKLNATVESSRAKLTAANARVAEAAATIEEKRGDYDRKKTLSERQVTSPQELALAKAAYERAIAVHANALAEVGVAEADLRVNETNLKKACICSPIDGVVLKRNVDPGQTVAVSLQAPVLFTIAESLKQMELQVDVDEADVGKTGIGQKASFSVDAYPDRKFPAEIRDIRFASETVQGVVTYKAVLTIDNSELLLRPGMTATAEIVVQEVKDALLVPNGALRFSPPSAETAQRSVGFLRRLLPGPPLRRPPSKAAEIGPSRTIWILRDGAPAAVPVVGGATDGKRTEILKGEVTPGQSVIVDAITAKR
jgi:HlyD family secretion protein